MTGQQDFIPSEQYKIPTKQDVQNTTDIMTLSNSRNEPKKITTQEISEEDMGK